MDKEEKQKEGIFNTDHATMLDAEWRLKELQPEQLIREIIGVRNGDICVDLASGTGTFSLPMAMAAGESGRVYAVDNSDTMIAQIGARNPPPQLITVKADVTQTGLDDSQADVCLLAFILHEVEEKQELTAEACRLLRIGGRLVVLEWRADADMPMPPRHRRVPRDKIEDLFEQTGLTLTDYIERTARHYVAIGVKHGR
jgi:ubiquinone/menaquinone biosynthesis C-methylase UbiE